MSKKMAWLLLAAVLAFAALIPLALLSVQHVPKQNEPINVSVFYTDSVANEAGGDVEAVEKIGEAFRETEESLRTSKIDVSIRLSGIHRVGGFFGESHIGTFDAFNWLKGNEEIDKLRKKEKADVVLLVTNGLFGAMRSWDGYIVLGFLWERMFRHQVGRATGIIPGEPIEFNFEFQHEFGIPEPPIVPSLPSTPPAPMRRQHELAVSFLYTDDSQHMHTKYGPIFD